MASRQTNRETERQTGTTPGQGGGLGAPGTTGATGARDPLGAPGSTGASRTNMGAPGYDPTGYSTGGGEQQQQYRNSGTEPGYTYGTTGSTEPTAGGYQAGVPAHATEVTGTYGTTGTHGTTGGYEPGYYGTTGVGGGGGYDTGRKMGERVHGTAGERTEHIEVTGSDDRTREFEEMGSDRARGVGGGEGGANLGGYDTGGRREGQRRG